MSENSRKPERLLPLQVARRYQAADAPTKHWMENDAFEIPDDGQHYKNLDGEIVPMTDLQAHRTALEAERDEPDYRALLGRHPLHEEHA